MNGKNFRYALLLGVLMSAVIGLSIGQAPLIVVARPTQETYCQQCHLASSQPGAAPIDVVTDLTEVTVNPGGTFRVTVACTGGEPGHMMVKWPREVLNNGIFTFSPREIYDGDDGKVDGSVASTVVKIVAPSTPGIYTIRVYGATSAYGTYDKSTDWQDITVSVTPPTNRPPTADFTYSPAAPLEGDAVSFTDRSTDPEGPGDIVSWNWNFGDGGSSTLQNPAHVYAVDSVYSVSLTVTDSAGNSDTETKPLTVGDRVPQASFTFSPEAPMIGDIVYFTDTSTSYDPIVSWFWDFGDGNTSTVQNPNHSYKAAGTYSIGLTVTDADGDSSTAYRSITISEAPVVPHDVRVKRTWTPHRAFVGSEKLVKVVVLNEGDQAELVRVILTVTKPDGTVLTKELVAMVEPGDGGARLQFSIYFDQVGIWSYKAEVQIIDEYGNVIPDSDPTDNFSVLKTTEVVP